MKKTILAVAMLLSAAGMQGAAPSGPQKLGIFPGNFSVPIKNTIGKNTTIIDNGIKHTGLPLLNMAENERSYYGRDYRATPAYAK